MISEYEHKMPTLSLFKNKGSQPVEHQNGTSQPIFGENVFERAHKRQSKREFLRTLIRKPGVTTESRPSRWRNRSMQQGLQIHPPSPGPLPSPMSDTNKPLPIPPSPSDDDPSPRPPPVQVATRITRLARIISPIAQAELHRLFSGAPQFLFRSDGHHTDAPRPSIAYPWNSKVEVASLKDYVQIQDEAWTSISTLPNMPASVRRDPKVAEIYRRKHALQFRPRCQERPNMLSMQGIERGTIGFVAALEMPVADSLGKMVDEDPNIVSENRRKFLKSKQGARPMLGSALADRLVGHQSDYMNNVQPPLELYTDLFTQILYPPNRVQDLQDPYSLWVQIDALVEILATPGIWYDLSIPNWRVRASHILWGSVLELDTRDGHVSNHNNDGNTVVAKYWLLFQILLSCELLLRLDKASVYTIQHVDHSKISGDLKLDVSANPTVRWSLILARTWLENVRVQKGGLMTGDKATTGWLASLTGTTRETSSYIERVEDLEFTGSHEIRQLAGLLHFARTIRWPNMESLTAKIATNTIKPMNNVRGPPGVTTSSQNLDDNFSKGQPASRAIILTERGISVMLYRAGWLSSSYISGFILPGEVLSLLLIATLLENDEAAVKKLGHHANSFGGFVYASQSFWSTRCLVGRVLSAQRGAHECMGWISSAVVPQGVGEGWLDIDAEPTRGATTKPGQKARIWHKTLIERSGSVIGAADANSVLPGDFALPSDDSIPRSFSITFESLDLSPSTGSDYNSLFDITKSHASVNTSAGTTTCCAKMTFTIEIDFGGQKEIILTLKYDVLFVTAHPCLPSPYTDILSTPTSPMFQDSERSSIRSALSSGSHPLHKAFTYTRVSILDILLSPATTSFSTFLSPNQNLDPNLSSTHTTSSGIRKVLVIDCTDTPITKYPPSRVSSPVIGTTSGPNQKVASGSDLEMVARALCAERGWNALISRRGRGCIACAVREAGALGWRVIIRLA